MDKYTFHLIRSLSTTADLKLIAQFDDGIIKEYSVAELMKKNQYGQYLLKVIDEMKG